MVLFSFTNNSFYDTELEYTELPDDLIKVSSEQHIELLKAINSNCIISADLSISSPKPSKFHEWNGTEWIDIRTEEEKLAYKRSQYPKLTRYQFMRGLLEMGFKSLDIEAQILLIEDEYTRELTLLGFKEVTNFVRTDESVIAMQSILNLNDEKVDAMWEYALTL